MATTQHPSSSEDPHERSSILPHEATPRPRHLSLPRGSLALLLGGALLSCGVTLLHMAWHGDQGAMPEVSQASHTEPTPPTPAQSKAAEIEEESSLPSALPFDEYVALKALELRSKGLSCGYSGRVALKVSFAPSGASTHTEVTPPTEAASCVTRHITGVTIPAFRGTEERSVQMTLAVR